MAAHVALTLAEGCRAFCQFVADHAGAHMFRVAAGAEARKAERAPVSGAGASVDPYFVRTLGGLRHERLTCLYYGGDGTFRVVRSQEGGPTSAEFDRNRLLRGAMDHDARYVVMAHNHPSGACQPSMADVRATRHLHHLFAGLGITLVDHVIVAWGGEAFSFRMAGLM